MDSIGFKNFRRFTTAEDNKPITLDLSGVNFFVGGNNAGKSTVTKAMMLVLDNLASGTITYRNKILEMPSFRLDANRIHEVHVGTFGRALHKPYPEVKELTFETVIDGFKYAYTVTGDTESTQANAEISKIEITNIKEGVNFVFDFKNEECVIRYNTNILKYYAIGLRSSMPFGLYSRGEAPLELEIRDKEKNLEMLKKELNIKEAELTFTDDIKQIASINARLDFLRATIKKIQKELDPFDGKLKIEDLEYKCPIKISRHLSGSNFYVNLLRSIVDNYIDGTVEDEEEMVSNSINKKYEKLSKQKKSFLSMVASTARRVNMSLHRNTIEYIPAHAATQKVLFTIDDKNDYMTGVIRDFKQCQIKSGSNEDVFVSTWMKNLEIGLGYEIKPIGGEAYTVDITNMDGIQMPLADMGMGSIQMMLLLLKLATIINTNRGEGCIIMIEEPEQNIHPKLQSLLAELFAYVHKEYHFRFIVETHSEYIIRKTQAMIAKGDVKFEENPFKVYYFPKEGLPYDMRYQESGLFENKFDEGFFDEASRQHLYVIQKARELR